MKNTLDDFVEFLQNSINEKVLQVYGDTGYDRWKNPRFNGTIERVDATAKLTGSCGDTMEIDVKMGGEMVVDIAYRTDGCASSFICGSFAAELAMGKTASEILDLTGETILSMIERIPKEEKHCAHLAIATVKEAINKYMGAR